MPAVETAQLGHLIRRFRLAAGLSQEELAERSGISARAVSDIERGLRTAPRLETVRMLADGLGLSEGDRANLLAAARPELAHSPAPPPPVELASPVKRTTALPLRLQPPPIPLTELIGRDDEVTRVSELLRNGGARLVTLIGPGGVGKTRLALAIADQLAPDFADGVAFIDLSALSQPDLVTGTLASGLGISIEAGLTPLDALRTALSNRSLLIVLDNFEHLLEAAPAISELLTTGPLLRVLVTSRARMQLRGEYLVHVSPLEVPAQPTVGLSLVELVSNPSVQLFLERAQESGFDRGTIEQNAPAIAEICRRLDGLPLAIELAASRPTLYPPGALLERLQHRLPALAGGARDAPARQRTLADTIAWSYDLLGPTEQTVFRRLAVFVGGFTLDAAEEVTGSPGIDVPAAIATLVESSLLSPMRQIDDEGRFTMLDTIHEFSASLFEQASEADTIQRRHADWCIRVAETAGAELNQCRNESIWYRRLDAEQLNTRAAIDFLLESGDGDGVIRLLAPPGAYWPDRPYPRDVRRWLEEALASATEPPSEASVLALGLLTLAIALLGDQEKAAAYADRQLQWAETVATPLGLGMANYVQAVVAEFTGNVERAAIFYERALQLLRKTGFLRQVLHCMLELGNIWLVAGNVQPAVAMIDEALTLARQAGAEVELAWGLVYRAFAALEQNDLARAAQFFDEGLTQTQRYRLDRIALGAIGGLSGVALALDQPDLAARLLGAVEAARQSSGVGRIFQALSVDAISTAVRERLGQEAFETCMTEGSRMTYQEAVDAALAVATVAGAPAQS